MLSKRFKKFYELGSNKYYTLSVDNELFLVTETVLEQPKKFGLFKRELTQGVKMLELTPSISFLFDAILNNEIDKKDEDFEDMTTYKKIDNIELRKNIEETYKLTMNATENQIRSDFEEWKDNFILENSEGLSEEKLNDFLKIQENRIEEIIEQYRVHDPLTSLSFKKPSGTSDNPIIKKMLNENFEFLYSQKIGSGLIISYLYDLDIFGTVTIYKVQRVRGVIKSIETFIYDKKLIEELFVHIFNNNL